MRDDRGSTDGDKVTEEFYELNLMGEINIRKYRLTGTTYQLQFRNIETDHMPIADRIEEIFDSAINHVFDREQVSNMDRVGVEIMYPELTKGSILIPFSRRIDLTGAKVVNMIERVLQSYEKIRMEEPLTINVVFVRNPTGGAARGQLKSAANSQKQEQLYRRQVGPKILRYVCRGSDNLCLPRCIILADAAMSGGDVRKIRRNTKYATMKAVLLLRRAGITHNGPTTYEDLKLVQAVIKQKLVVFDKLHGRGHGIVFIGHDRPEKIDGKSNVIALELFKNHYSWLSSIPAYLGSSYFCLKCRKKYSHRTKHMCSNVCRRCLTSGGNCSGNDWRYCVDCFRSFPSDICFNAHKSIIGTKKSACSLLKLCDKCKFRQHPGRGCNMYYCALCGEYRSMLGHTCYVATYRRAEFLKKIDGRIAWPPISETKFIFFDFETAPNKISKKHEVVFAAAQVVCDHCKDSWPAYCTNCNEQPQVWWLGENSLRDFCQWLFDDDHEGAIAFAHNGKGFDFQFILRFCIDECIPVELIPRGMSIMQLVACNVRLLCSHNFLAFSLKALPALFNLTDIKGSFPFSILDMENLTNEPRQWPSLSAYGVDHMKEKDRTELINWHNTVADKPFYLVDELRRYCIADCTVLRTALMKFRDEMRLLLYIDPFESSSTLPSSCLLGFRHRFLKPNTMQIIPEQGFDGRRVQSKKALKYFHWLAHKNNVYIRTAASPLGEYRIPFTKYYADGVIFNNDGSISTILCFLGCYWHCCVKCFPYGRDRKHANSAHTYEDVFQHTMSRIATIKQKHPFVNVILIWEHEYDHLYRVNSEMRTYVDNYNCEKKERIFPRDAYFGARTENMCLYKNFAGTNQHAIYLDFCSLYPYVLKYCRFPIGAASVIVHDIKVENVNGHHHLPYFGIARVCVLPKRRIRHPVLPMRTSNGRLIFPLCATCAELRSDICTHTEEERRFWGVYTTFELELAFENGYVICIDSYGKFMISEVWHWENSALYDPTTGQSGLFSDYVDLFLKRKTEASGFPPECTTDDERKKYIADFYEHERIQLDYNNIRKNPSARQVSKLCANSSYGKFGQNPADRNIKYVTSENEFFNIIFNDDFDVKSVVPMNDNVIMVKYDSRKELVRPVKHQSLIHALMTTSYGRVKLYSELSKIGTTLYCDTDSVVAIVEDGAYIPSTGNYIGDLTNELGENEIITEFVATSAKSYSMRILNQRTGEERFETKVKGFTLDFNSRLRLNHKSMVELALLYGREKCSENILITRPTLQRSNDRTIENVSLTKTFRVPIGKRIVLPDLSMVPFGYFNPNLID